MKKTTLLLVALATPLLGTTAFAQTSDTPAGNSKYPSYDEPTEGDGDEDRDAEDRPDAPADDAG